MLAGHPQGASGNCIACVMEGSRPLLAEVQALAAKTQFGVPRRTAAGVDYNRMVLLLAILEKRCGLFLSSSDVYVNVVGGMRLDEPAVDLPMLLAIASSFRDKRVVPARFSSPRRARQGGRRGAYQEDEPRARQNGRRRHQGRAVMEAAVSNPSFGADFFVFSGQAISRRCFAWKERLGGSV